MMGWIRWFLGVGSVDGILSDLRRKIARLEEVAQTQRTLSLTHSEFADHHRSMSFDAAKEADRAINVADRLGDLIA